MDLNLKLACRRSGFCTMGVPPVNPMYWSEADWVAFVDATGFYHPWKLIQAGC